MLPVSNERTAVRKVVTPLYGKGEVRITAVSSSVTCHPADVTFPTLRGTYGDRTVV